MLGRSEFPGSAAAQIGVEVLMEEYARSALLLTVKDVMRELNLGRSKVEALMKHEGLPVIRFGRVVRVLAVELKQWGRESWRKQSA